MNKSTQDWSVGKEVKVGFLSLRVKSVEDYKSAGYHTVYKLENKDGTKLYKFSSYEGLEKVNF